MELFDKSDKQRKERGCAMLRTYNGITIDYERTVGHWVDAVSYLPMAGHHLRRFLRCLNGVDPTLVVSEATPERIRQLFEQGARAQATLAWTVAEHFPEMAQANFREMQKALESVAKYGILLTPADIGFIDVEHKTVLHQAA